MYFTVLRVELILRFFCARSRTNGEFTVRYKVISHPQFNKLSFDVVCLLGSSYRRSGRNLGRAGCHKGDPVHPALTAFRTAVIYDDLDLKCINEGRVDPEHDIRWVFCALSINDFLASCALGTLFDKGDIYNLWGYGEDMRTLKKGSPDGHLPSPPPNLNQKTSTGSQSIAGSVVLEEVKRDAGTSDAVKSLRQDDLYDHGYLYKICLNIDLYEV
ncbi:uncharacterized protein EDB91DRAFT_1081652 [Suillus paluster]|uniref:uncharacterized protein n=1 Tax=Suillus paluster TaxID=48578 RepID=UPI001B8813C3|nr:uncharacterized protein EDB91DRAFT_1081652 [Suillus paluster]KAG1741859.1 hypothetical protein EDB91DRAFT_1081652 [Suillus paluster]